MTPPTFRQAGIIAILSAHPDGITAHALAKRLGIAHATVHDHIRPMREDGRVVCVVGHDPRYLWCLAEHANAIRVAIAELSEARRKARKRRQMARYRHRRRDARSAPMHHEDDDDEPGGFTQRLVSARDAPALSPTGPRSVFELAEALCPAGAP